jgi:hypothetical protein
MNPSLMSFNNKVFDAFVDDLDRLQGDHLREMCAGASEIVKALFREELPSQVYAIEMVEPSLILQYPRQSPEIHRLLSPPVL